MPDGSLGLNASAGLDVSSGPEAGAGQVRATPLELLAGQDFVSQEAKGLVVDLTKLEDNARLVKFVGGVFQGGCYFKGLNFKYFMALLYDFPLIKSTLPQAVLAAGLAQMDLGRLMLYQGELTATPREAHYDFTYRLDSRLAFASGVKAPTGEVTRTLDEFVAAMWNKGVRFGLDLAAVEQGLAVGKNKYLRLMIAKAQPPESGANAWVERLVSLDKDLRPLESEGGQVDLRRYLCVFPQARAQQIILRRVPPQPGRQGHTVFGEPIPTSGGKDLSLQGLAGQGTVVAQVGGAECLVATRTGYVSVHPRSGAVSVTEEVINHTPVGIKTGSLTLEVERCLQYGGVGAGYTLEGNNLLLKAGAVEGYVISHHGNVGVEGNVAGGQITARQGDIQVTGLVQTGSRLEAYQGRVSADLAENSVIVAREVVLRRAVNSVIIAQQATIGECMGASVFANGLEIERVRPGLGARTRGGQSAGTTLAVPIAEPPTRPLAIIKRTIETVGALLPQLESQTERISGDKEVQSYLRALKAYQGAGNEEEARRHQLTLQPLEGRVKPIVDKWRAMLVEQNRIKEQTARLEADAQIWRDKIKLLEDELQGSMKYAVKAIEGDFVSLRLYKDPRLPLNFEQAAGLDPARRRQFEELAHQMVSEIMSGHSKELILTLKEPFKASYRDLMILLAKAPDRPAERMPQAPGKGRKADERRAEARLVLLKTQDLPAYLAENRRLPPQRLALPVKVDQILEGYFGDLTGVGAGVLLNRQQKYVPIFQEGGKVVLSFQAGTEALDVEMVVAVVRESERVIRIGGFFVNLPNSQQAIVYKLKNLLEARLRG